MRVAVIGAGAIGGFYGAALTAAGHDVSFLAHGRTLEALRADGLRIVGEQSLHLDVPASDDAARIGPVDVVLMCTKTFQVADAARSYLPALMGPDTLVVTTQNGVQAPGVVAEQVGRGHVAPGVCRVWSKIAEPGVIDLMGGPRSLIVGSWDDAATPVLSQFRSALREAGIATVETSDIWTELWTKVIHVVPQGAVGALLDATLGELLGRHLPIYRRAMTETADVARGHGAKLPDDVVETTLAFVATQDPSSTTSFQRDIASGRPSEFDAQVGAIPGLGDEVGVDTPVNDVIAEVLGLAEERHRRA